jgi:MATE family multidrug resistance protein
MLPSARETAGTVFALGTPVVLSQSGKYIVTLVSVALLGHIGQTELAAVGLASSFCNVTGYFMIRGMAAAVDTLSTQAYGAKDYKQVGVLAQRAVLIATAMGSLPATLMWLNAERILLAVGQPPAVCALVQQFALLSLPSLWLYCLQIVLQKVCHAPAQSMSIAAGRF